MAINGVPHNQILLLIIQWLKRQWLPADYPEPDPSQPADPVALNAMAAKAFGDARTAAACRIVLTNVDTNWAEYHAAMSQIDAVESDWIQKRTIITG